jgi:hypothetical protein
MTGTYTDNSWFYRPGYREDYSSGGSNYNTALSNVDARLSNEVWVGDPKFADEDESTAIEKLINAINQIDTKTRLRVPAGTYSVTSDLVIDSDLIILAPEPGAIFQITGSGKLTCCLECGLWQCFDDQTTGLNGVVLKNISTVYPEWWVDNTTPGTTDMLSAFKSAISSINATGGVIRIGNTTYNLSGELSFNNGITLQGNGYLASKILYTGDDDNCFLIYDKDGVILKDLSLLTDQNNGTAIRLFGRRITIEGLFIGEYTSGSGNGWNYGIWIDGSDDLQNFSNMVYISESSLWCIKDTSLYISRSIEVFLDRISGFASDNSTVTKHLVVDTGSSGIYGRNCSFGYGKNGVVIQHLNHPEEGLFFISMAPNYLFFNTVLCDTTTGGSPWHFDTSLGGYSVSTTLDNCWGSGGGLDGSGNIVTSSVSGLLINNGQGIFVSNSRFRRNTGSGVFIDGDHVVDINIDSSYITANNLSDSISGHGIYGYNLDEALTIKNCRIANTLDSGTGNQKYGIKINSLNLIELLITNNNLYDNEVGGLLNNNSGPNLIFGNIGSDENKLNDGITIGYGHFTSESATLSAGGHVDLTKRIVGGFLVARDQTHGGVAVYLLDELGLGSSKLAGDTHFVIGSPSSDEIGVECDTGKTRISNGYSTSINISISYISAVSV